MKTVLVTGGAGFIGSNLIREMLKLNYKVYCIENFDSFYDRKQKMYNISDFINNTLFQLIEKDILQDDAFIDLSEIKIDIIVHLAAKAGIQQSIRNPLICNQVNILGTLKILELAKENRINKVIFASSSSVYGINTEIPWIEKNTRLKPISPYASSKIAGENLCYVYHKLYGLSCIILRFFTVYGPGQRPDLAIHKFAKHMLLGKEINMYGNGATKRDYTYVDDIISGILSALKYEKENFEIVNLGNNYAISLNELVDLMEEVFEVKIVRNYLPLPAGDVPVTFANIEKAKTLLNYYPTCSLTEGLGKFKKWYQDYYE